MSQSPLAIATIDDITKELPALVAWLGTFPEFQKHHRVKDFDSITEDVLNDDRLAFSTLQVVQEIFTEPLSHNDNNDDIGDSSSTLRNANDSWASISHIVTSNTLLQSIMNDKQLSPFELKVALLTFALGYSISESCKERRTYVGRIMWGLERPEQHILMTLIEQQKQFTQAENSQPSPSTPMYINTGATPTTTPGTPNSIGNRAMTTAAASTSTTDIQSSSHTTPNRRDNKPKLFFSGGPQRTPRSGSTFSPALNTPRSTLSSNTNNDPSTSQSIIRGIPPRTPRSRATTPQPNTSNLAPELKQDLLMLVEWLQTFSYSEGLHFGDIEDSNILVDDESISSAILKIAEEICDQPENSESVKWDRIRDLALIVMPHALDGTPFQVDTIRIDLLSALLCHAVSEKCEERKTYIGRIMGLSREAQQRLMTIIETGRNKKQNTMTPQSAVASQVAALPVLGLPFTSRSCESVARSGTRSREEAFGAVPTPSKFTGYTPQRKKHAARIGRMVAEGCFSPHTIESALENMVEDVHGQNVKLMKELEASQKREGSLGDLVHDMEANHRKTLIKVESAAFQKEEESCDAMKIEISSLQQKVEDYQHLREREKQAQEELAALRDEVDILQPMKERIGEAGEKLRHYKERLELLGDVKEALKQEEEAHSASVEECLRVSNELSTLQPLKRQLEDYKTRAIDAEVQLAECQTDLNRWEQNSNALNSAHKDLLKGVQIQREEADELRRRLDESSKVEHAAMGVGEGISELNPAVKEEMLLLRNENTQLKKIASKHQDDSVQKLEEQLDDKDRLSSRFKEQFLSTKGCLKESEHALSVSEQRERELNIKITEWEETSKRTEIIANQYKEQLDSTKQKLDDTHNAHEDVLAQLQGLQEDITELNERCNNIESISTQRKEIIRSVTENLEATEERLAESQICGASLLKEVSEWTAKANKADELSSTCKDELSKRESIWKETEQLLSDSKNQEKELELVVADLIEKKGNLEAELTHVVTSSKEVVRNADASFESARQNLLDQSKREKEEIEMNMNHLLEEERKAHKEQKQNILNEIDSLRKQLVDLKETTIVGLQHSDEQAKEQLVHMEKKYTEMIKDAKSTAAQELATLMTKGQAIIKETQEHAGKEMSEMDCEIDELKDTLKNTNKKKDEYEAKTKGKLLSYKNKLHFATGRINDFTKDNDDLQDNIKGVEREKFKLQEENDRFRRQLGGRFGADGKVQSQFDMLQKEFNLVVEENRSIKKNLTNEGHGMHAPVDDSASTAESLATSSTYSSSGGVSRSTLSHLREEYEATIVGLNDEKRELIMRNSAAITDVQKAEHRAWTSDKDASKLNQEVTSLKLALNRVERHSQMDIMSSCPQNNSSINMTLQSDQDESIVYGDPKEDNESPQVSLKILSATSPPSGISAILTPNKKLSTPISQFSGRGPPSSYCGVVGKLPATVKKVPSLMEYTTVNEISDLQGQQECQQS